MRLRFRRTTLAMTVAGSLIIGLGLSYFVAMTEDTRYEMTEVVRARWHTSYDIVVRPLPGMLPGRGPEVSDEWTVGAKIWKGHTNLRPWSDRRYSVDELERDQDLLEANYLSGIPGGLTFDDLDTVRSIPGVQVAAPVAACGTARLWTDPDTDYVPRVAGVFRVVVHRRYVGGATEAQDRAPEIDYRCIGEEFYHRVTGRSRIKAEWVSMFSDVHRSVSYDDWLVFPLAAVDPTAEAELVGLDRGTSGTYLPDHYEQTIRRGTGREPDTCLEIPVIVRSTPSTRYEHRVEIYRLPLDPSEEVIDQINDGGTAWLDQFEGSLEAQYLATEADIHRALLERLSRRAVWQTSLEYKAGPLNYCRPGSRHPLRVEPTGRVSSPFGIQTMYRWPYTMEMLSPVAGDWLHDGSPRLGCVVRGFYDVERLQLGRDPLNELPMDTYRPGEGLLTRDPDGNELSRPVKLTPVGYDLGLVSVPPLMLTTLDVARVLYGDNCISAIRVRVAGAADLSEESRRRIEWVAKEIAVRTGLRVDVTTGSSPSRHEVFVDGLMAGDAVERKTYIKAAPVGYVELPFVKKNVSLTVYNDVNRANVAILGAVLAVAVLYVFTHAATSVYSRVRDLAVCRALGWRPGHVLGDVVGGAALFGGLAAVIGVGLSFWLADWGSLYLPHIRLIVIALTAISVYVLGSLLPGIRAGATDPMVALAVGEAGARVAFMSRAGRVRLGPTVIGLALGGLLGRWRRQLLTLLTLAVAGGLLSLFLMTTINLRGVLTGSLLGEFLILQVGPRHILTAVLCLGLAVIAVAETVSLNLVERRGELELLAALGWRPSTIRWMVVAEGAVLGLAGGLLALILSAGVVTTYLGTITVGTLLTGASVLLVSVLAGALGAFLPASAVGHSARGRAVGLIQGG